MGVNLQILKDLGFIYLSENYDPLRKQVLLECFKSMSGQGLSKLMKNIRLNLSLRLWAGCLDAAKTLSLKTQSGPNTREIRSSDIY